MTAGSVADPASAIVIYEHVLLVLQAHGTNVTGHATSVAPQAGDSYFGWLAESPVADRTGTGHQRHVHVTMGELPD